MPSRNIPTFHGCQLILFIFNLVQCPQLAVIFQVGHQLEMIINVCEVFLCFSVYYGVEFSFFEILDLAKHEQTLYSLEQKQKYMQLRSPKHKPQSPNRRPLTQSLNLTKYEFNSIHFERIVNKDYKKQKDNQYEPFSRTKKIMYHPKRQIDEKDIMNKTSFVVRKNRYAGQNYRKNSPSLIIEKDSPKKVIFQIDFPYKAFNSHIINIDSQHLENKLSPRLSNTIDCNQNYPQKNYLDIQYKYREKFQKNYTRLSPRGRNSEKATINHPQTAPTKNQQENQTSKKLNMLELNFKMEPLSAVSTIDDPQLKIYSNRILRMNAYQQMIKNKKKLMSKVYTNKNPEELFCSGIIKQKQGEVSEINVKKVTYNKKKR